MFLARTAVEFSSTALSHRLCATCYIRGAQDSRHSKYFLCDNAKYWYKSLANSANTIKIVRGLILWSISTGMLTWYVPPYFFLWILSQWVQDKQHFISAFCNPFLNSKYCLVASILFHRFQVMYLQASRSFFLLVVVSHSIFFVLPQWY